MDLIPECPGQVWLKDQHSTISIMSIPFFVCLNDKSIISIMRIHVSVFFSNETTISIIIIHVAMVAQ